MAKPVCPKCGGTDITLKSTEDGVTGNCRGCGAKLRGKRKVQKPGTVPSPPVDSAKDPGSAAGVASDPSDAATPPEVQPNPLKGAMENVAANPATTVYMGGEIDLDAIHNAEADAPEEWKLGDNILGLYEVKRELGKGGMGKVWLVHHHGWNVDLAVKAPRPDWLAEHGDAGSEQFKREAETWANLGLHPHIVSCYYVRDLGGIPRVFAEYVEGGSLEDWITGDKKDLCEEREKQKKLYESGHEMALERILDIAIQFAWGLHYAHEQGLVHQDVKPGNVMMTPAGIAKVTDFGLVGARADERTIAYQSPEQAGAAAQRASGTKTQYLTKLDRTTDIWSWGVSILEMFTGGAHWGSGSIAEGLLDSYLDNGPVDQRIPRMPDSVVELLKRCFKEQPSERYQTMLEVAEQLEEIYLQIIGVEYPREYPKAAADSADSLNNRAISMLDLGKREEAQRLLKEALTVDAHHPQATFNLGLLRWRDAKITDADFVTTMEEMRKSHQGDPDINNEAKYFLNNRMEEMRKPHQRDREAALLLARVHSERGDPYRGIEVLESIQKTAGLIDEIGAELENLREQCGEPDTLITTFSVDRTVRYHNACFSRDGRYMLFSPSQDKMEMYDTSTWRLIQRFDSDEAFFNGAFLSDDGSRMLSDEGLGNKVTIWNATKGTRLHVLDVHTGWQKLALSSDGDHVLSGGYDGSARLWSASTGRLIRTLDESPDPVWCVCFSGNGRYAVTGGDKRLRLWDVITGRRVRTFFSPEIRDEDSAHAVWLTDNGDFLLSGKNGQVRLWETSSGRCVRIFQRPSSGYLKHLRLTDDFRYAWWGDDYGALGISDVSTGRCVRTRRYTHRDGYPLTASEDGRFVLNAGRDEVEILTLGESESRQAALALSRVVKSEEALEVDSVYKHHLLAAWDSLSIEYFIMAAAQVRIARSVPGCSKRPDAMEIWGHLHHRLPRKELRGGWAAATFPGHCGRVFSVTMSRTGQLAFSGSKDGTVRIWKLENGTCLHAFPGEGAHPTTYPICVSDDERYLVAGSQIHGAIRAYNVQERKCVLDRKGLGWLQSICLGHDGKFVLLAGGFEKATVHLWHVPTNKLLRVYERSGSAFAEASLSHDNRYALCTYGTKLELYDLPADRSVGVYNLDAFGSIATSPLFLGMGQSALIGVTKEAPDLRHEQFLVESIDGRFTGEGFIRFTKISGNQPIRLQSQLTQDGHHAVTIEGSHLLVWDLRSGNCVGTFDVPEGTPTSVCISPDGGHLLSGHENGDVILWVLDWELEDKHPADWDDGAAEYLQVFLDQHMPYAGEIPADRDPTEEEITLALTRRGKPTWTEEDFKRLLHTLGCVGYGWLRPEGVRKQLEAMARVMPEDGFPLPFKGGESTEPNGQNRPTAVAPTVLQVAPPSQSAAKPTEIAQFNPAIPAETGETQGTGTPHLLEVPEAIKPVSKPEKPSDLPPIVADMIRELDPLGESTAKPTETPAVKPTIPAQPGEIHASGNSHRVDEPPAKASASPPWQASLAVSYPAVEDPLSALIRMIEAERLRAGLPSGGSRIASYAVVKKLGQGGTGAVYLATRDKESERVAIKVMLSKMPVSEHAKKHFLRGIEVMMALKHPNIVTCYEHGFAGSGFFCVLELCEGGDVFGLMTGLGGKLPVDIARPIMLQSLEGLAYAHDKRYVHRDLKPPHVLLTAKRGGIAKIAGWGLAKNFDLAGFSEYDEPGTVAGAMDYMPKEQLLHYRFVKPVTDVWSMGATFYHMLTGMPPRGINLMGQNPVKFVLQTPAVPIRRMNPSISEGLAHVINKSLSFRPEDRYENAGAFLEALKKAF